MLHGINRTIKALDINFRALNLFSSFITCVTYAKYCHRKYDMDILTFSDKHTAESKRKGAEWSELLALVHVIYTSLYFIFYSL